MDDDATSSFVILLRLESTHGFSSMADAIAISGQLQERGINAIAEAAPGGLMDSPGAYFIKVPHSELDRAKEALNVVLHQD